MIADGTYNAKVISHGISETKDGEPQAAITFSFECDGPKTMTYYGSFKEGARKHTIKALLVCGLKGSNPAGDLEIGREVRIVIGSEEYQGKTRQKIQWVNALGGSVNLMDSGAAMSKLEALQGAVLAARQELNIQDPDDSEIPF